MADIKALKDRLAALRAERRAVMRHAMALEEELKQARLQAYHLMNDMGQVYVDLAEAKESH